MISTKQFFSKAHVLCLVAIVLIALIGNASLVRDVQADSLILVTTSNSNILMDGQCSLREAIINANGNSSTFTDCPAGSGNDIIAFDDSLGAATITLTSSLPTVSDTSGLTILGGLDITINANGSRALFVNPNTLLVLDGLTISNGFAGGNRGGAVYNNDGILTISNSTFSYNGSSLGGGAVYNTSRGTLSISNSTFVENSTAGAGGGVSNLGILTISNSTFISNHANDGGGLYNSGFPLYLGFRTVINSTFSENTAVRGGGINTEGNLWLYNTIIANNLASIGFDCHLFSPNSVVVGNNNLIEGTGAHACGLIDAVDGNIIGLDPQLGPLEGSPAYLPLADNSPAINTGDDAQCASIGNVSQNGLIRPVGEHCEIGSYESSFVYDPTPQELITELIVSVQTLVDTGVISHGNGNALITKLEGAIHALDSDNTTPAVNKLGSFINQVSAFINSGKLTPVQGQTLIDAAQEIIDSINGL